MTVLEFAQQQLKNFKKSLRDCEVALENAITKKDKKMFQIRCDGLRHEKGIWEGRVKQEEGE